MINYYEVLEVSQKASDEIIEKAYKVLAKKYHPDLQQGAEKKAAEEKMKLINEAYDILSNKEKREEFDRKLANEKEKEAIKKQTQSNVNNNYDNINIRNNYSRSNNNVSTNNINQQTYNREELKRQQKYKESLEKEARRRYLEAYDNYLRSLGYRVKYRWTWERVKALLLTILVMIIISAILWWVPYTREILIKLYQENFAIKLIVDLVGNILEALRSIFKKKVLNIYY